MEALNGVDELETQLQGLESWIQLPIAANISSSDNLDRISDDSQRLVDMLQQFQSALRSAVIRNPEIDTQQFQELNPSDPFYHQKQQHLEHNQRFARQAYPPPQQIHSQQHSRMYQGGGGFPEISDVGSFMHDTGDLMLPGNGGPIPLSALNPSLHREYMQGYPSRVRAPDSTSFGGGADVPSPYAGQQQQPEPQQYPPGSSSMTNRALSEGMQCPVGSQSQQQPPQHNPGGYAFQPSDYN